MTSAADRPAATGVARRPLEQVLAHRRWVRRAHPFPHVVAQNVFTPACYAELAAQFTRIERSHPEVFRRDMAGYDASGSDLDRYRDGPLGLFVSREWHDLLAAVTGVQATGDVTASLHHHEAGGSAGWPHNDLNPGWFAQPPPGPGQVRLPSDGAVEYHHGTRPPGVDARESVRAVSLLFYLANPAWEPGDGGETGLYSTPRPAGGRPDAVVAPINNSLVLFECTPYSWHGFLGNAKPRNSIVMWLHRTKDEAAARWGAQSIVYW